MKNFSRENGSKTADAIIATEPTKIQNDNGEFLQEGFIKIDEVCALLKVSKPTIHAWKKSGMLPFYRIGSRIFFRRSEILAALRRIDTSKEMRQIGWGVQR